MVSGLSTKTDQHHRPPESMHRLISVSLKPLLHLNPVSEYSLPSLSWPECPTPVSVSAPCSRSSDHSSFLSTSDSPGGVSDSRRRWLGSLYDSNIAKRNFILLMIEFTSCSSSMTCCSSSPILAFFLSLAVCAATLFFSFLNKHTKSHLEYLHTCNRLNKK